MGSGRADFPSEERSFDYTDLEGPPSRSHFLTGHSRQAECSARPDRAMVVGEDPTQRWFCRKGRIVRRKAEPIAVDLAENTRIL